MERLDILKEILKCHQNRQDILKKMIEETNKKIDIIIKRSDEHTDWLKGLHQMVKLQTELLKLYEKKFEETKEA